MMRFTRTAVIVVGLILAAAALRPTPVQTQSPTVRSLEQRAAALESQVATLVSQVSALQAQLGAAKPDGPCLDNTNRYVACGNGTVTDTVTGLIWLQQADCLANNNWVAANQAAAGLQDGDCGLTDGSSPGDWRLPTGDEWRATQARARFLSCQDSGPSLMDDAGTQCYGTGSGSSFTGLTYAYWSSSSSEVVPNQAFFARADIGSVFAYFKVEASEIRVWPVRSGPR